MSSSEEEVIAIADLVSLMNRPIYTLSADYEQIQKGANGARADDTKGMKSPIIDWITLKGQSLTPHIPRNVKSGRGFNHDHTGALLCPAGLDWNNIEWVIYSLRTTYFFTCNVATRMHTKLTNGEIQVAGDQWPIFLYANYTYDPEDPWNGLLHSGLLVSVSPPDVQLFILYLPIFLIKAYKHIFTSPSSVDQEPKATRSGNAHIHGMRSTTKVSLAYVATQVWVRLYIVS